MTVIPAETATAPPPGGGTLYALPGLADTDMYDAAHDNVDKIPTNAGKVAGYVSGSPAIQWTQADWDRFPHAGHVRIEQGFGGLPDSLVLGCDVLDVEAQAITPYQVPAAVHLRISHGIRWTTIYGTDTTLADVRTELLNAASKYGHGWFYGHVDCWLAGPNLSRAAATALLGKEVHGLTCRAVQIDYMGSYDVSVTQKGWHDHPVPGPNPMAEILADAKSALGDVMTAGAALNRTAAKLQKVIALAEGK